MTAAGPHVARYLAIAAVAAAAACAAYAIGDSYIDRLPDHRGYYLVAVDDRVGAEAAADLAKVRPRHAVVIVADGLRRDAALTLRAVARLRAHGQCAVTDAGSLTVSRPAYAILSTGLEADRTGSRNNDETSPLAAESIWEVAREAGLTVRGISELPWWQQLFPDGFTSYAEFARADDMFADAELADLTLIHPVYIDEEAHDHGAASAEYAAALARLDRELAPLLDRLDLSRDLVVLTADHGHTDAGGHGGSQPEVRRVLTCFAGRGVSRGAGPDALESRVIAPALAVLLGLRFPRHMRATDDSLGAIWKIADPSEFPAEYLLDRTAAIDRFRDTNRAQIAEWLGTTPGPGWDALYHRERLHRAAIAAAFALCVALALGLSLRRRGLSWRGAALSLIWLAAVIAASCAIYVAIRGSFDFTSINKRATFIRVTASVCGGVGVAAFGVHLAIARDVRQWLGDQLTLMALALAALLGHIVVYGWPLGFPVPGAAMFFLPFFGAVFGLIHAALAAVGSIACAVGVAVHPRWRERARPGPRRAGPRRAGPRRAGQ